jgi:hypothetical protein
VRFIQHDSALEWKNHNHFLTEKFYFGLGRDKFYPSWNGMIKYFSIHFGHGAFITEKFSHHEDFKLSDGLKELFPDFDKIKVLPEEEEEEEESEEGPPEISYE